MRVESRSSRRGSSCNAIEGYTDEAEMRLLHGQLDLKVEGLHSNAADRQLMLHPARAALDDPFGTPVERCGTRLRNHDEGHRGAYPGRKVCLAPLQALQRVQKAIELLQQQSRARACEAVPAAGMPRDTPATARFRTKSSPGATTS